MKSLNKQQLLEDIMELNIKNAAIVDTNDILFSSQVRKYCEMNQCGKYGVNWACPPGVGPLSTLKEEALEYQQGLVLQTLHIISSSFDWKGMMAAKEAHEKVLRLALGLVKERYEITETLLLGAGSCEICASCSYEENQPCRYPDKALASLEAYGIDVVSLTKHCNMPYHHGANTVSYVGLILFKSP